MVGGEPVYPCISLETFRIRGHRNVRATHRRSLEFTKEEFLTERGDCIVGVSSTKALKDFNQPFKELVRRPTSLIITLIIAGNLYDVVVGRGGEGLTYSDDVKIIIRRSNYVSGNTAAINSDKAAKDLDRELVNYLRTDGSEALVIMFAVDLNCFRSPPLPPNLP